MSIIQKNVFGDNIIYNVPPIYSRQLTTELQKEIISVLESNNIKGIMVRFEHGGETGEFANKIAQFLIDNNYTARTMGVMASEIQRNEFSIQRNPGDPTWAFIKIGPIN
jgi:hypothetical protein